MTNCYSVLLLSVALVACGGEKKAGMSKLPAAAADTSHALAASMQMTGDSTMARDTAKR